MRVAFVGESLSNTLLRHRVVYQGETVTDVSNAEIVIAGADKEIEGVGAVPIVLRPITIPSPLLEIMGYTVGQDEECFLVRWFDAEEGWADQVIVGFKAKGLMNEDLGARYASACGLRFTDDRSHAERFEHPLVEESLRNSHVKGFVRMGLDAFGSVTSLGTKIKPLLLATILEKVPNGVADHLANGRVSKLHESWAVGLVVSRFPFPFKEQLTLGEIDGITFSAEKHLWLNRHFSDGDKIRIKEGFVGVSTAWGNSLFEANRRALGTCRNLTGVGLQYRTDLAHYGSSRCEELTRAGVL